MSTLVPVVTKHRTQLGGMPVQEVADNQEDRVQADQHHNKHPREEEQRSPQSEEEGQLPRQT